MSTSPTNPDAHYPEEHDFPPPTRVTPSPELVQSSISSLSLITRTVAIIKTHALHHRFDIERRIQEASFEVGATFSLKETSVTLIVCSSLLDREREADGIRYRDGSRHVVRTVRRGRRVLGRVSFTKVCTSILPPIDVCVVEALSGYMFWSAAGR